MADVKEDPVIIGAMSGALSEFANLLVQSADYARQKQREATTTDIAGQMYFAGYTTGLTDAARMAVETREALERRIRS